MKESRAYLEILNEGEVKGAVKTGRRDVLAVVRARFGKRAATTFTNVLKVVENPTRLHALHDLALHCSTLDELRQAVAIN